MASSADFACPTPSTADAASGDGSSSRPGQRGARGLRGLAQRVEFGQPADVVDERVVLAGLRCDGVDLVESELQPVGLLRELACPLRAVGEVAAGGQPVVAQLAVALQLRLDVDEAVQRRPLFVGSHQPQLVVLAVQRQQLGGERAQRLRGHAAAAEVGPRRPVAADRPRGDDAAVVVAVGSRGIQDLVDLDGDAVAEFGCGETAFDDRALGAGAHPGGVGAGTAEQVQPVTTIVLPVPVSPVSTVSPRSNSAVAVLMAPSDSIRISDSTTARATP